MQGRSATAGALPHCSATHLPEDGYDIRTLPQSLGHSDLQTAMVYTHVTTRVPPQVRAATAEPANPCCRHAS
jgi:site-specific recombinase XerD